MVQRYELELFHQKGGPVNPCDDGGYVEYEDYAKLEADFKAYKASAYTVAEQYAGVVKELEAELQKYKDQFPDYVECANCGSVTHVEGVE